MWAHVCMLLLASVFPCPWRRVWIHACAFVLASVFMPLKSSHCVLAYASLSWALKEKNTVIFQDMAQCDISKIKMLDYHDLMGRMAVLDLHLKSYETLEASLVLT